MAENTGGSGKEAGMRNWRINRRFMLLLTGVILLTPAAEHTVLAEETEKPEKVVLRVCNWEEYIDLGDWDEEETIELPSADIIGENSMVEDFE